MPTTDGDRAAMSTHGNVPLQPWPLSMVELQEMPRHITRGTPRENFGRPRGAAGGPSLEATAEMKTLRSSPHEITYGLIFLVGLTLVCAGLAVFPTYSRSLGLALVVGGVVVVVTGALIVDSCATHAAASGQCRPPAYEAVMAHREEDDGGETLFLGPRPGSTRRHWSLPSPWCTCAAPSQRLLELSGVNDPRTGRKLSAQLPRSDRSERERLQGRFVYALELPAAHPHGSAANYLIWSAGESWSPERHAIGGPSVLPDASFDGASPVHPARVSRGGGKCAPRRCEPPSYDAVLAGDLRGGAGGLASPRGRMTRGRSSAPELLLGSTLSTAAAAPVGRADR
ncbi:uncharacterized protein [Dermacentor albipictus]|uniref:uncharacterized protein isoform X2 n=1 Tax=Dermacentor albipictus TaxID=60249 RepID=UPI0031FCED86